MTMNEDTFNMSIRKFLKQVGVTSQRQIERTIGNALEEGKLAGNERLAVRMTLELPALGLTHRIEGEIGLE
jgi:hypothetical protein